MSEQAPVVETITTSAVEGVKDAPKEVKVAEEAKPEIKEEDIKARRFAELSKKEQRILRKKLEMDKEMKDREAALVSKEQDIKRQAIEDLKKLAQTNPDEALKMLETDYNRLTDYKLNAGKPTPETVEKKVLTEVDQLRQQIKEMQESQQKEKQTEIEKKNQEVLKRFNDNIVNTIKTNADKYPSVSTFDGAPVIYEMIQKRYHDTGGKHLMTIEEAAETLEKDLSGRIEELLKTPTWSKRFAPLAAKEEKKSQGLNKPTTITNEMTPTAPSLLPPKTENDRLKRALAKLNGEQLS